MLRITASTLAVTCILVGAPARAGDKPVYAPAPAWVVPAPPIDPAKLPADGPAVLVFDAQQRIEGGRVHSYLEVANRATSAEVLAQLGTVALPWTPDKGDLIVHSAEIVRPGETIDLLKGGEAFTVLRREQQLEQRTLTGLLTATMTAEGLRVGDVLRVRYSVTNADPALGGRAQTVVPLPAAPLRFVFGRARLSWPANETVAVRGYSAAAPEARLAGGYRSVEVALPLAKPAELPGDLPARLRRPTLLDATTFGAWEEVSRTMASLYATDGGIAAGSPLAAEVAKIAAAHGAPRARAAAALRLVQDEVRYLAMGMNGGNYVPQSPARTWELRYGDCKAKTLLLLAMLRALGVEAEAVLASMEGGDFAGARPPMPGAFDHVLVRAVVDGDSYWLDGTGAGTRAEDIGDTPAFGRVLPLRPAGAGLMAIAPRAPARPEATMQYDVDQRAGLSFPPVVTATVTARGPVAAQLNAMLGQLDAKQRKELVEAALGETLGDMQLGDHSAVYDPATGVATIRGVAVTTTAWKFENKRRRLNLSRATDFVTFEPDRARAAWRDLPVAARAAGHMDHRLTVRLPNGGAGYAIEGDAAVDETAAGVRVVRTAALADGRLTLHEVVTSVGGEVAADAVVAERARAARGVARAPRLLAPASAVGRWQQIRAPGAADHLDAVDAVLARAIADNPDGPNAYRSRLFFRAGRFAWRAALADADRLVEMGATEQSLLLRSQLHEALAAPARALADARAALDLAPGSSDAIGRVATLEVYGGAPAEGLARLDARIADGGADRFAMTALRAQLGADAGGSTAEALASLDAALAERPGDATLLNARCWLRGTHAVDPAAAVRDCSRAIEVSDAAAEIYDSRALAYIRMERWEEARADLDAALNSAPDMEGALFLRAIVRARAGDAAGAAADLAGARTVEPGIDRRYARWGLKAPA